MFIVTVKFLVHAQHREAFLQAMYKQAEDSITLEADCTFFDVCISEENENLIFLYEKYTRKEDFDLHLASDHFVSFAKKVGDWVEEKIVETYTIQK